MHDFTYLRPDKPAEAMKMLEFDAVPVAGSTELLNWMRLGIAAPATLVDITRLPDMNGVRRHGGELVIGALTTLNEVGEHRLVAEHAAVLGQACLKAASAQIRNRATLGGNVLQKTRCGYFRAEAPLPWGCNKRQPGSGCGALNGASDHHAVFGWTEACIATQPSDPVVALAVLDAVADLMGPSGARSIAVADLHLTPAEADPTQETRLRPGELIVRYRVPIRQGERSAYLKIRERESYAYAVVSAAAAVRLDGDRVATARVALGSVALKPWRLATAEPMLRGVALTREALLPVISQATADARPAGHSAYKLTIARNAAVRALMMAGGAA